MDYQIIFYNASKTGICERAVTKALHPAGFTLSESNAAADKRIFGNFIAGGFVSKDFIVVIGNSDSGEESAYSLLSSAMDPIKYVKCKKIADGAYLLTCDAQALLVLPDSPIKIYDAFKSGVLETLKEFFNLT